MPKATRPIIERLMEKVEFDTNAGCWLWTGSMRSSGYGRVGVRKAYSVDVHRVSFNAFVGRIPRGQLVLHRCDTPLCIRPDHLFLGTNKTNSEDMRAKSRARGAGGQRRFTEAEKQEIQQTWHPKS